MARSFLPRYRSVQGATSRLSSLYRPVSKRLTVRPRNSTDRKDLSDYEGHK